MDRNSGIKRAPYIRLTVAWKIAAGYLLVVAFCLAAILYALLALGSLTRGSENLVLHEFKALVLARDLSRNLLDQERLEKQIIILRDASMIPLLDARQEEGALLRRRLTEIPLQARFDPVERSFVSLNAARREGRRLLEEQLWGEGEQHSLEVITPLREQLLNQLQQFHMQQERLLDDTLRAFSKEGSRAYRFTLTLAFVGIGLAGLVAAGIILKIQRSIARLTQATKAIAAGSFNPTVDPDDKDEFGILTRDFADMAQKLRELQKIHLDASPLTRLPGNLTIERELEGRISSGLPFAHIYIDLDYFKAYNDRYGYQSGSDIIAKVAVMVQKTADRLGNEDDLIGHIGGDDYVILSTPDKAEAMAVELIREFDAMVPGFYSEQDRKAGFFTGEDRYGVERQFPLLSMSIAVVCSENLQHPTAKAIGRECAKMKEYMKKLPGSNYLLDRRERR